MTGKAMLRVDLHVHTSHSGDSRASPGEVVRRALELGLDAVGVTDHNTVEGAREAALRARGTPLLVIPGQEIETAQGEILVLGLREDIPAHRPAPETMREAKSRGGFVIVPHPFDILRKGLGRSLDRCIKDIDAIEVYNSRTMFGRFNRKAAEFAERRHIPTTAGSDSHFLEEMGQAYMVVDSAREERAILEAMRSGRTRLVISRQGRPSLIRRGLLKVGTYFY